MMFVTMLLQVTVNAVPIEEPTNNSDISNDCECVPFYMCTNETINVYGNEILDLRYVLSLCIFFVYDSDILEKSNNCVIKHFSHLYFGRLQKVLNNLHRNIPTLCLFYIRTAQTNKLIT